MSVIRFPPYIDLRGQKPPMASFLTWWQRLFGKPRDNVIHIRRAA